MTISSKRAEHLAGASLALSVIFFIIALLIGQWSEFFAVSAVSWMILAAALIWLVLLIQFHQRALAEQEKLDMAQLAKDKQTSTIFQTRGERDTLFAVAQRRLKIIEKWFLPVFSALIAVFQLAIGLYLVYLLRKPTAGVDSEPKEPLLVAICMTAIAFISFLMSRYATGMSGQPQWKPLRAGGSFLLGVAVLCFALAVSLALVQFKILLVISIVNWVIPILLIVLGAETTLNVVLDVYRPRLIGQYHRSAFDSRLLGLISEPGGILRTAATAIDYQFGFEVSQTWFYKLLEKAIVPLVLFAAVILYSLSCILVVAPNEQAIIEHFGNPARVAQPGLTFKWPWPIDKAYKHATKTVLEIPIGYVPKTKKDPDTGKIGIIREPLLWGQTHYEKEYHLLVASEQTGAEGELAIGAVPVSLVIAAVPVQYRIKDLYSFIYKNNEPEKLLEFICYRELTKFAASARIEVDTKADLEHSLLGAGRIEAKETLTREIQDAADEAGLGVEIVFVGLQGIHPPPQVAADYQDVVGAVQKKQALILTALAERNKTLGTLAGSVKDANELYVLAAKYQQAREQNQLEQSEKLGKKLDSDFLAAKGDIFTALREAQSYAFEKETLSRAAGQRFASQIKAYSAAEEIYMREQRLAVFEEALKNIRKYVVVADQNDRQVIVIDLTEKLIPSLYELEGLEEISKK